jgi:hypothetical protein
LWNINSKGDWSDSLNYRGYLYQVNVEDLRTWNAKHEREILKKLESNLERSQTKDSAEFYLGKKETGEKYCKVKTEDTRGKSFTSFSLI